jgi:hypothetical protein
VDFDLQVKLAIYRHFAATGGRPTARQIAQELMAEVPTVLEAFERLQAQRVLVLESDRTSILMAPPFSGIETMHVVEIGDRSYFANCAWDTLGIAVAIGAPATVRSRCGQTGEPLVLEVGETPPVSDWVFHCLVPAAHWWDDIVFT